MNAKVVTCNDQIFLITSDESLLKWGGNMNTFVVPEEVFTVVENFINLAKDSLEPLMVPGPSPGTILYWEENVHDKLVEKLNKLSGFKIRDISNSLSALGY